MNDYNKLKKVFDELQLEYQEIEEEQYISLRLKTLLGQEYIFIDFDFDITGEDCEVELEKSGEIIEVPKYFDLKSFCEKEEIH